MMCLYCYFHPNMKATEQCLCKSHSVHTDVLKSSLLNKYLRGCSLKRSPDHSKCHRYALLFLRSKSYPCKPPDPCYMLLYRQRKIWVNCGRDVASCEGSKRSRGEGLPLQSKPDSSRAFTTTLPALLCPAVEEKTKSLVIIF